MSTLINNKRKKGFTLIELLIVIAIFTIITTIALFDQGRLNSNVLLTNLAYDVALTLREAQSYGVGVKYSGPGIDTTGGYGVFINTTTPDMIVVFHDLNDNGMYDGDAEEVKTYLFSNQRGNKIAGLCGVGGDIRWEASDCNPSSVGKSVGKSANIMNITFKRPNPEGNFKADEDNTFLGPAYIVLKSLDQTNCRAVVVEGSGQIRVEGSDSDACPEITP